MSKILSALLHSQQFLSSAFDRLLPSRFRVDGCSDFLRQTVPEFLTPKLTVYDIGGGKNPAIDLAKKQKYHLKVIGIDIDQNELAQAPQGYYQDTICTDITVYQGKQDADLIICLSILEHVHDNTNTFKVLYSILKPGGKAIIFMPCRNAIFARLNLLLPEKFKCKLMDWLFPESKGSHGFKPYYDHCTPSEFMTLIQKAQLNLVNIKLYYASSYFSFCFPVYFLWRTWQLITTPWSKNMCEAFTVMIERPIDKAKL